MKEFSEKLKELREEHDFSQSYMAETLGISQPAYAKYENNQAEPDYEKLCIISEIFEVTVDELLGIDTNAPSGTVVVTSKLGKNVYHLNNKQIMLIDALCREIDENNQDNDTEHESLSTTPKPFLIN